MSEQKSETPRCANQSKESTCPNHAVRFHILCEACRIQAGGYIFARKVKS